MTPEGEKVLIVMLDLEVEEDWMTARKITEHFEGLEHRKSPVMTVSSYLTHLKRAGYVERKEAKDKSNAWWRLTEKGRAASLEI